MTMKLKRISDRLFSQAISRDIGASGSVLPMMRWSGILRGTRRGTNHAAL
jgi:hypothetical protein